MGGINWASMTFCIHCVRRYGGQEQPFTIERVDGDVDDLPTASTCFNTLRLPEYRSEHVLEEKLRLAMSESHGFHEGAISVSD